MISTFSNTILHSPPLQHRSNLTCQFPRLWRNTLTRPHFICVRQFPVLSHPLASNIANTGPQVKCSTSSTLEIPAIWAPAKLPKTHLSWVFFYSGPYVIAHISFNDDNSHCHLGGGTCNRIRRTYKSLSTLIWCKSKTALSRCWPGSINAFIWPALYRVLVSNKSCALPTNSAVAQKLIHGSVSFIASAPLFKRYLNIRLNLTQHFFSFIKILNSFHLLRYLKLIVKYSLSLDPISTSCVLAWRRSQLLD